MVGCVVEGHGSQHLLLLSFDETHHGRFDHWMKVVVVVAAVVVVAVP